MRAMWKTRVGIVKKLKGAPRQYLGTCSENSLRPQGSSHLKDRGPGGQVADILGKKKEAPLDISFDKEHMELEHELCLSRRRALGPGRVGEANGLMTRKKQEEADLQCKPLGMRSWSLLEWSAAN